MSTVPPSASGDTVAVPRELLTDLLAYSRIHTVENVSYGPGRSHAERIAEAQACLHSYAVSHVEPSKWPGYDPSKACPPLRTGDAPLPSSIEPTWTHVHNKDELESFYRSALPKIREAAKECGYAVAVHGSLRRDLDLIAVPWKDEHADKDVLAHAVMRAACGMTLNGFRWENKPLGRVAVSFPVCWTERSESFPNETNLGHIDLSVMPAVATSATQRRESDDGKA